MYDSDNEIEICIGIFEWKNTKPFTPVTAL